MNTQKSAHLFAGLLFPTVFIYYEILLRVTTIHGFLRLGTLFTALFCACYGMMGYLLSTLTPSRKWNHIIATGLTFLTALPFLVEYFIFRQFNQFYDLNTMTGGATDAVTGFADAVFALIFSWNGILMILLFLLPTVLVAIFGRKWMPGKDAKLFPRLFAVGLAVIFFFSARIGLMLHKPSELLWTTQHNFQSAVDSFGLITGMGLDLRVNLSGTDTDFENIALPVITVPTTEPSTEPSTAVTETPTAGGETTEPTEVTEATEPPVVYVPQVMDLNLFDTEATGIYAELNKYVSTQIPSMTNEYTGLFEGKNLILITAEAFCAEVIDPELTPTLYRMATRGIHFTDFYQPSGAGTTGGEYQHVFGMLPTNGGISFKNTHDNLNYFTMGNQLNRLGYWGKAYHNNDYTFYDRHMTHINLGYSEGFMGYGNGMENMLTSQYPTSDLEMFIGTLPEYIDKQPFNVYYMTFSGHSNYYANCHAQVAKNYHRVEHLEDYPKLVRSYLAAQLELEDTMTYLLEQLEAAGILNDTVICLTGDHFPYGLDEDGGLGALPNLSALYGYNVTTALELDHNALILWSGCLEEMDPIVVDSPTSTLDVLPTLSNLFGTEFDSRLMPGRDVLSGSPALVFTSGYDWKTDYGTFYSGSGRFVPTDPDLPLPEGYVDTISAIVRNKIRYCDSVLDSDYFRYLFGSEE